MLAILRTFLLTDPFFFGSTAIMGTISLLVSPFDKDGNRQIRLARFWAKMNCWSMGIRVKFEGLEKLDLSRNYIFASNHLSYTDTPALLGNLPLNFRFLAKSGLFSIPFMGSHLRTAGHIPVMLENPFSAVRTLGAAGRIVREKSLSLLIFPEGGRSAGKFGKFKGGAAYLAIQSGVPVVPVALIGTREILPMHGSIFHPGNVLIKIGDPLPVAHLTRKDRKQFTRELEHQVATLLDGKYGSKERSI